MPPPRQLYLTQTDTLPMTWTSFRVKRAVFQNADNIDAFHIEGTLQGKSYQLIYNTYGLFPKEIKPRIEQLKRYSPGQGIEVKGFWETLSRVIGGSLTRTTSVLMKEFRPSSEVDDNDFGVPRSSVFVKRTHEDELLLHVLDTHIEARKAKLKVEDVKLGEVMEKIVPSKRAADEESSNDAEHRNESQRERSVSESPSVGHSSSRSRIDSHGNGAGSSQSHNWELSRLEQRNTPPVQVSTSTSHPATQEDGGNERTLNLGKLGDSFEGAISIDSEDDDMGEKPDDTLDQSVPSV